MTLSLLGLFQMAVGGPNAVVAAGRWGRGGRDADVRPARLPARHDRRGDRPVPAPHRRLPAVLQHDHRGRVHRLAASPDRGRPGRRGAAASAGASTKPGVSPPPVDPLPRNRRSSSAANGPSPLPWPPPRLPAGVAVPIVSPPPADRGGPRVERGGAPGRGGGARGGGCRAGGGRPGLDPARHLPAGRCAGQRPGPDGPHRQGPADQGHPRQLRHRGQGGPHPGRPGRHPVRARRGAGHQAVADPGPGRQPRPRPVRPLDPDPGADPRRAVRRASRSRTRPSTWSP